MIDFNVPAGAKVLELGGGANRHPKATVNVDIRRIEGSVDFALDFNKEEWTELSPGEFDIVYACFVLEHVSWRNVPNFLKQTFRVLKPGGKALFVIPNTEAQMKHILSKPGGFDGDEGSMLFGDQNYAGNFHSAAFSPSSVTKLFTAAGFTKIVISPYGALATDMVVEASKPEAEQLSEPTSVAPQMVSTPQTSPPSPSQPIIPQRSASERFNLQYFERYCNQGFYWDYPNHEIIARRILERSPKNALELGCARGYVLKRIQDQGIPGQGIDVSPHAWLTRVCDPINTHDLLSFPWPIGKKEFDFVYSLSLLEHIPEPFLPSFIDELQRVSNRGLHAITLEGLAPNHDSERTTLRNFDFWKRLLPEGHEVVDVREIGAGELPADYINPDGRVKLNLGSAYTHYHRGWINIDTVDADNFAKAYRYNYARHDLKNGLPYSTGVVDLIHSHHCFEHFTYEELAKLLKECRRVIRPDGAMRIAVPNTPIIAERKDLQRLSEMSVGIINTRTRAERMFALLAEGHKAFLDEETLFMMLDEAGWVPHPASFRTTSLLSVARILRETLEMDYGGTSFFCDATPKLG